MRKTNDNAIHLIDEMNRYYEHRAPWHDEYMSYESNEKMETRLRPIIELIGPWVRDRKVLEIACGTGNWTQVLAKRARSVYAVDFSKSSLDIAQSKEYAQEVEFEIADAYCLDGVRSDFEVAFSGDWLSHVPRQRLRSFFKVLHEHLLPGATVIMVEMLFHSGLDFPFRLDEQDNRISDRTLPDGTTFEVIRNYLTEAELRDLLSGIATDIVYTENKTLHRSLLRYTVI